MLDYRNEYRKTKNNISASRAREDLLGSVQRDIDEYKGLRGGKQEMYAREREHLINSDRLADQAIEIARLFCVQLFKRLNRGYFKT